MRSHLGSAAAIAAALFAGSAIAADLPTRKEPPPAPVLPPPPPTWNGLYLGLNIGGGWTNNNNNNNNIVFIPFATAANPVNPFGAFGFFGFNNNNRNNGGVVGGGQVGYNYQFMNSFVGSLETDIQGTSIGTGNNNNNNFFFDGNFRRGLPWFGTVRGRVGFLLMPTLLVYGTGGFAYGGVEFFNQTRTRTGWTAGGGVEYLFWQNWSAKIEYLFVNLNQNNNNNNIFVGFNGFFFVNNQRLQANIVRAGLNWHFNYNPPPVLARY